MKSTLNQLANINNPYQGKSKKVLCLCSAGLLRSPTAANVLHREFEFTIISRSATGMLKMPSGALKVGERINQYCTGILAISMLHNYAAPTNAPGTVDINVYMCGGSNFQYYNPLSVNNSLIALPPGSKYQRTGNAEMMTGSGFTTGFEIVDDNFVEEELDNTSKIVAGISSLANTVDIIAGNTGQAVYAPALETITRNQNTLITAFNAFAEAFGTLQQDIVNFQNNTTKSLATLITQTSATANNTASTRDVLSLDIKPLVESIKEATLVIKDSSDLTANGVGTLVVCLCRGSY